MVMHNNLFHAMVKSTVILQNVSENKWNEREEALEALGLVKFKEQSWTSQAGKHFGKFVITSQPQHKPQDGMQRVGVNWQTK